MSEEQVKRLRASAEGMRHILSRMHHDHDDPDLRENAAEYERAASTIEALLQRAETAERERDAAVGLRDAATESAKSWCERYQNASGLSAALHAELIAATRERDEARAALRHLLSIFESETRRVTILDEDMVRSVLAGSPDLSPAIASARAAAIEEAAMRLSKARVMLSGREAATIVRNLIKETTRAE